MYLYFKKIPQKPFLLLCLLSGALPSATLPIMATSLPQQADADSSSSEEEVFPLHKLVQNGQEKLVKSFIKNGNYDINLLDEQGKTPLDYAIPDSKIYNWLVKKGAKASQGITHPSGDEVDDSKEADPGDTVTTDHHMHQPAANPQQLHDVLVAHYQKQDTIPGMLGDAPQSITDCYIRLSLTTQATHAKVRAKAITKRKDEEDEKEPARQDKATEELLEASLDYNQLYQVKVPIEVADLWKIDLPQLQQAQRKDEENEDKEKEDQEKKPDRTEPIRHITIVGEAGSGKTTLTQRIAYQWAHQELWPNQFDWLMVIPLRSLYGLTDFARWEESMSKALDIPSLNTQSLRKLFDNKNQKGLLILDGYDEIAHKVQENPEGALGRFMAHCLNNKNLHLILTSRPVQLPTQLQQPRDLHVIGFQQAEIDQYVHAYFKHNPDIEKPADYAEQLLATLQQNPNLRLLSHTPLYLRLFCLLAKEGTPTELADKPLTQLYQQLIDRFVSYAWQKKTGQKASTADAIAWSHMELTYLSYLAWLGMENSQAALSPQLQKEALQYVIKRFPRTDPSMPSHWQRIRDMGFLQNLSQAQYEPEGPTYFAHLTVQEFLAARFLAESLYRAPEPRFRIAQKALRDDKYTPRYQVMLPFVVGQLYHNVVQQDDNPPFDPQAVALLHFWELLQSQPRELSGIHHAVLVMRGLEACLVDTSHRLPQALRQKHIQLLEESRDWLTAFWKQMYGDTYYDEFGDLILSLPLASVLNQGLSTTHKVLAHPLIVDTLKEIFASWRAADSDRLWKARYAKLQATSRVALATTTEQAILEAIQRRFTHNIDRKAMESISEMVKQGGFTQQLATVYHLLHRASTDANEYVRREATWALGELAKNPKLDQKSLPRILTALTKKAADKDKDVRKAATKALGKLSTNPHVDQESLLLLLHTLTKNAADAKWYVRDAATEALVELAKNPKLDQKSLPRILTALTKKASDKDKDVRKAATWALVELAKNPKLDQESLPRILTALTKNAADADKDVRREATWALGELAKNPKLDQKSLPRILTALTKKASDKDKDVRKAATKALVELAKNPKLDQESLLQILATLTKKGADANEDVREAADRSLQALPKSSWQAVVDEQCTKPVDNSLGNFLGSLIWYQPVQQLAQALLRYSSRIVVSQQNSQLAGYKRLVQALKQEAQQQDYPTAGYRAIYLALPDSIQAPELPRLQRVPHYYTPLHTASQRGDCTRLAQLCTTFPAYINHAYNDTRSTPLLWAAQHGQWEAVKVLIQRGAWIDATHLVPHAASIAKTATVMDALYMTGQETAQTTYLPFVLAHRTLFPRESIQKALQFMEEKFHEPGKPYKRALANQGYRSYLSDAVGQLVGKSKEALEKTLIERASNYEAASRGRIAEKIEDHGVLLSEKEKKAIRKKVEAIVKDSKKIRSKKKRDLVQQAFPDASKQDKKIENHMDDLLEYIEELQKDIKNLSAAQPVPHSATQANQQSVGKQHILQGLKKQTPLEKKQGQLKRKIRALADLVIDAQPLQVQTLHFAQGEDMHTFLRIRIYLLFEDYVELSDSDKKNVVLPNGENDLEKVRHIVLQELQTQLTTLWDSLTRQKLYDLGAGSAMYRPWAQGIVHRLDTLAPHLDPYGNSYREMNLGMAHDSHFFYLSISKQKEGYALRIDNRWMDTVPEDKKHQEKNNGQEALPWIKPYCVAWYPAHEKVAFAQSLQTYVEKAASLYWKKHQEVMPEMYSTNDQNNLPGWLPWTFMKQQTTAQNCYMSNHNQGVRIRLGKNVYNWFKAQERASIAPLIEKHADPADQEEADASPSAVQAQSANTKHQVAVSLTISGTSLTPEPQLTAQQGPGQGHRGAPSANNQSGQVGSALGVLGAVASGALHRK